MWTGRKLAEKYILSLAKVHWGTQMIRWTGKQDECAELAALFEVVACPLKTYFCFSESSCPDYYLYRVIRTKLLVGKDQGWIWQGETVQASLEDEEKDKLQAAATNRILLTYHSFISVLTRQSTPRHGWRNMERKVQSMLDDLAQKSCDFFGMALGPGLHCITKKQANTSNSQKLPGILG